MRNKLRFIQPYSTAFVPVASYALMIIFAVVYGATILTGGWFDVLDSWIVLSGVVQSDAVLVYHEWYRMVTGIFLHGSLTHLLANMLGAYIVATRVEKVFGKWAMLAMFMLTAIAGNFAVIMTTHTAGLGASGGLFGLEAALVVYCSKTGYVADGIDKKSLTMMLVIGLASGIFYQNVSNAAHIGGAIAGLFIGLVATTMLRKH